MNSRNDGCWFTAIAFGLDAPASVRNMDAVRAAVIFNPTAKGNKARAFHSLLATIAEQCTLRPTQRAGDAARLAGAAVQEGFDTVIAAGGDGTLNEVLNGLAETPDGLERCRLGVLPLGTVNVFARELGIPLRPETAWSVLQQARERRIDLPYAEWSVAGRTHCRYFAQLAGAGLDARAIELTSWELKKKIGPLAYIVAGLRALAEPAAQLEVRAGTQSATGQLVLVGNGRLYGGSFRVFPHADLADGVLDVCVFPKANWMTLIRCGLMLLGRQVLPEQGLVRLRTAEVTVTARAPARFEVEGELGEHLPVKFAVRPRGLRVLAPATAAS
jgi:YegS/Rv2252/BmrU family lipid kinase